MVIYFLLKFHRALHFVKMKTVLLTFWVFIIISLSFYCSFIMVRPYRGDCELAENSTRLLCLMLPLCAHPWSCSLAWSRSLLHLGLSFSLLPGRLHSLHWDLLPSLKADPRLSHEVSHYLCATSQAVLTNLPVTHPVYSPCQK